MAVTAEVICWEKPPFHEGRKCILVDFTLDNDYQNPGGWPLATALANAGVDLNTDANMGFPQLQFVDACVEGYVFQHDRDNNALRAFEAGADGAGLDEVTDGDQNLDGLVVRAWVYGY